MSHLQPAIHLAKKMGKKLGQYHLLQRKMPSATNQPHKMKTYLVIGGSSGIGEGVVKELAHDNVVIATYCKNYKKDETSVQYVHFDVMSEQDLSLYHQL
jgi:hypothetical protein